MDKAKRFASMTEEEYEESIRIKNEKTLYDEIQTLEWDYKHGQIPLKKKQNLKELVELRMKEEISIEEKRNLEELNVRLNR